jgi:hypothetical protein
MSIDHILNDCRSASSFNVHRNNRYSKASAFFPGSRTTIHFRWSTPLKEIGAISSLPMVGAFSSLPMVRQIDIPFDIPFDIPSWEKLSLKGNTQYQSRQDVSIIISHTISLISSHFPLEATNTTYFAQIHFPMPDVKLFR